jgi:NAD(P)H-hydrate epimerase
MGGERPEQPFIRRAAQGVADETALLFAEIRRHPPRRILVAAGTGNNAADALLAAQELARHGRSAIHVILATPVEKLNPNALEALQAIRANGGQICEPCERGNCPGQGVENAKNTAPSGPFDVLLDGLLGHGFHPPAREPFRQWIRHLNARDDILLRVAVDLPSGLGDTRPEPGEVLRADATIACGFVKAPLLRPENAPLCGRLRLVPVGFPANIGTTAAGTPHWRAATPAMLLGDSPLARPRPPLEDKRHFGHLLILGGERNMPGALLMNVRAALRAGCGLVTALCPESVHAAFAAAAPEAMWLPWPETPEGTHALEGEHLLRSALPRATAFLCGSGIGASRETQVLLQSAVAHAAARGIPVILDAGAIQPKIVAAAASSDAILLPHAGEYARILPGTPEASATLAQTARALGATIALKGAPTRIAGPCGQGELILCGGGPFLARGGSGDILAGIVGALFARGRATSSNPANPTPRRAPEDILSEAVAWHALAADRAARRHGQDAATVLAILDELSFPAG